MLKRRRNNESQVNQYSQKRLKKETSVTNESDATIILTNHIRKLENIIQLNTNLIKDINQKIDTLTKEKHELDIRIINIIDYLGLPFTISNHNSYIS
jgi:hypothetical protein